MTNLDDKIISICGALIRHFCSLQGALGDLSFRLLQKTLNPKAIKDIVYTVINNN